MTIQMICTNPACAKALRAREDQAGKLTDCPFCGARMRIPSQEGPFVPELKPDGEVPTQPHVEENEVVDWIGPAGPMAGLQAAVAAGPEIRPPRPAHKAEPQNMPPLTADDVHAEGKAAINGEKPPRPAAADAAGDADADADSRVSRIAVNQVPVPAVTAEEPPEPSTAATDAHAADPEPDDPPERRARGIVLLAAFLLLFLLGPISYVLVQIFTGAADDAAGFGRVMIILGISLLAMLTLGVVFLVVLQRRLRRIERLILTGQSGHDIAHREIHEAVRDTHRRLGAGCPRCHQRIELAGEDRVFECPSCGLLLAEQNGELLDRQSRDADET